ncbi:hypothetical protein P154DRAFT_460288, partial [Amniculicola lignicola CBS 123094]
MMSLLELISQNQPHFQTHKALIVIGLQNDFILPDGKLPVNTRNGFVDRISTLIPNFRKNSANVIWLQTLYETDRLAGDPSTGEGDAVVVGGLVDGVESSEDEDDDFPKDLIQPAPSRSSRHKQRALDLLKKVSTRRRVVPREVIQAIAEEDEDEELFLLRASKRGPACQPNTPGAEFADSIKTHIEPSDTIVQTTNYSAFLGTRLLLILRAKLVTELYICGCITNVSVLATVVDAARHGIKINVVEDCLGFRKQSRHDEALKRMVNFFDANLVQSEEVNNPRGSEDTQSESVHQNGSKVAHDELQAMRNQSDASAAESRNTTDTKLSDKEFMDKLTQGAKIPDQNIQPTPTKQKMVKSKIRMRTRSDRNKKEDDKKAKAETAEPSKKGETNESTPEKPRRPAVIKAESSDKLREGPIRREKSLKSSASQPSLSSLSLGTKERLSSSRMRFALSRATKSESHEVEEERHKGTPASPAKSLMKRSSAVPIDQSTPPSNDPPPALKPNPTPTPDRSSTTSTTTTMSKSKLKSLANFPTLGPGDTIAEGDSRIIYDFFPSDLKHPSDRSRPLKDLIFTQLYNEVHWQKMLHQQGEVPRLVCCQGEFGPDGSMPVYRHPTDQALPLLHFSPKVHVIRKQAEKLAGHPLNHVLIQLYRSGNDYISEHSDKTLDIVRGSNIVNVSFGAQRTMRLRTKKDAKSKDEEEDSQRTTQRVAMPHNSMFVLGLESNQRWLHGIMADKRIPAERSAEETAYSGMRISLTFRHIGTFLDAENTTIWGQGATSKEQRDAQEVINDSEEDNERIVRAFSKENHESTFSWDEHYGSGFDVLHFRNPPEDVPILFASHNTVETKMVQIFLAEMKMNHIVLEPPALVKEFEVDRQVCYRDTDIFHTETINPFSILGYLDRFFPLDRDDRGRAAHSASCDIAFFTSGLSKYWMNRQVPGFEQQFIDMLECLEERVALSPGPFITGRRFALGDCAAWPVVDDVAARWEEWDEERFPALTEWWRGTWRRK